MMQSMHISRSILCIILGYTEFYLLSINSNMAFDMFNKWPWFSGILFLTVINFLFPFFFVWSYNGNYNRFMDELPALSIFITSLSLLLIYPGSERLGIHSDSRAGYVMFGIIVFQQIVSQVTGKEISKYKNYFDPDK